MALYGAETWTLHVLTLSRCFVGLINCQGWRLTAHNLRGVRYSLDKLVSKLCNGHDIVVGMDVVCGLPGY